MRPVGSAVGALGGALFVVLNACAVPGTTWWRLAAVVAAAAIGWFVVLRGPRSAAAPPQRGAVRTYGFSVVAMVVALPVGSAVLGRALGRPEVVPVWVVLVVGAHFWPVARALRLPVLTWLSGCLVVVALLGGAVALVGDARQAAGGTGVVAGVVILAFSALGPRLGAFSCAARP